MMGENNNLEMTGNQSGEELLKQLFHLKGYEIPETSRMTRNKQNIMRQVREVSRSKRKTVGDLLEGSFPWFFAEPKYGVALLFVAFVGLQYMGVNARHAAQSDTGIYTTTTDRFAAYEQSAGRATNKALAYPEVSSDLRLFPDRSDRDRVKWVNNPSPDWQK